MVQGARFRVVLLASLLAGSACLAALPTTSAAVAGPARCLQRMDAYGYTCAPIAYDPEDIELVGTCAPQGAGCLQGDDQASDPIALPFAFPFYGQDQSEVLVTTNGLLLFGDDTDSWAYEPARPPDPAGPHGLVAVHWTDLQATSGGLVTYASLDEGSRFVVQWTDVGLCCSTPGVNTFQVVLFPDGSIEVHQDEAYPNELGLVGLEGPASNLGLAAAFDGQYHSDLAWRFSAPAVPRALGAAPDLYVELVDGPDEVVVGQQDTVTFVMSNRAPTAATGVLTRVSLPPSITVDDLDPQCVLVGRMVTCNFGDPIWSEGSDVFAITFTAQRPGVATFMVRVAGAERDVNPSDNALRWSTQLSADAPDLVVSLFAPPSLGTTPSMVSIAVDNAGSQPATNPRMMLPVPRSVVVDSAPAECVLTGMTYLCDAGSELAPGGGPSFQFTMHAGTRGQASLVARASTDDAEVSRANNAARRLVPLFPVSADLGSTFDVLSLPAGQFLAAGQSTEASFEVANNGPDAAAGVLVRLTAPNAMPFDVAAGWSAEDPAATCTQTTRTMTCRIPTLDPGRSHAFGFSLRPAAQGLGIVTATATSRTPDASPANNGAALMLFAVDPAVLV